MDIAPYKTDNTFKYTTVSAAGEIASAKKAEVIWQESIGFITSATISGTTLTVNKQAGVYGNALVGIYDASDNLLWSYHIWAPEDNPTTLNYTQTLSGQTYKVMSMPLGGTKFATEISTDADKAQYFGMYYQWGRKDPLGRTGAIASNTIKPVYDKNGTAITLTDATYIKNISDVLAGYTDEATDGPKSHFMAKYTIKNPMEFLRTSTGEGWSYESNPYFWGNFKPSGSYPKMNETYKSIFDPSPKGYRVAPEDTWVNFNTLKSNNKDKTTFNVVGNETFDWTSTSFSTNRGYSFYYQALGSGPSHFYGASAIRYNSSGNILYMSYLGYAWSSSKQGNNGTCLYFADAPISPLYAGSTASGMPVYCVAE